MEIKEYLPFLNPIASACCRVRIRAVLHFARLNHTNPAQCRLGWTNGKKDDLFRNYRSNFSLDLNLASGNTIMLIAQLTFPSTHLMGDRNTFFSRSSGHFHFFRI